MAAWLEQARAAGTYQERDGALTREREQQILSEL
jgi:hypothetical protein